MVLSTRIIMGMRRMRFVRMMIVKKKKKKKKTMMREMMMIMTTYMMIDIGVDLGQWRRHDIAGVCDYNNSIAVGTNKMKELD